MAIETAVADVRQEYEVCVSAYVKTIDKTINDKDKLIASYKEQRLALRAQNTGFKRKADDPEKSVSVGMSICTSRSIHVESGVNTGAAADVPSFSSSPMTTGKLRLHSRNHI
jgi:hypothetical protein